ncbi:hypothetical protein [Haloferula sargassicola]|uniref:hypothetical protein n=1 Tax=Haloferula sargassicola TaxID=490096 RepID=UPI003365AA53
MPATTTSSKTCPRDLPDLPQVFVDEFHTTADAAAVEILNRWLETTLPPLP